MTFRVRIISPLKATENDIIRRQQRYQEHADSDTTVTVLNLDTGPAALNTPGDVLLSAASIFQRAVATRAEDFDAILIDCVFDPSVAELQEATSIPTFGPTRTTLALLALAAPSFSIVARTDRQCEMLADVVAANGYTQKLRSLRALGITYEQAKQEHVFAEAMIAQVRNVVAEDGAQAVMFGSTTMALTDEIVAAASGVPLFMPGLTALRVMETLWNDKLWPQIR